MNTFNSEFIQRVKNATNLVDLVKEYAPDFVDKSTNSISCRCPHPEHEDKHASFNIRKKEQTWCCYACHTGKKDIANKNYGSDCIAFLQWISNGEISFIESVKILAERANIPLPNDKNQIIYNNNLTLANYYIEKLDDNNKQYLYNRGLNNNDIAEWMIGYNPQEDRITFPMFDKYKNILGFNRRLVIDKSKGLDRKYLLPYNSEILNKSEYLYGLHNINKKFEYIIVTEGVFDVILATKYNVKNVVCTLGSSVSMFHVKLIKDLNLHPILIYDNDKKGILGTNAAMDLFIQNNVYPSVCILPSDIDLADMCVRCKTAIPQYIKQNTFSYGYLQCNDIIKLYNQEKSKLECKHNNELCKIKYDQKKELEELNKKFVPYFNNELLKIPNDEKELMKEFINKEINIEI